MSDAYELRTGSARSIATFMTVLLVACGSEPQAQPAGSGAASIGSAPEPTLATATEIGLRNAHMPLPGLVSGGQPTQEQLEALADAGYVKFISLRPSGEDGAGWEEEDAKARGYNFTRLPIAGAASLTKENVEMFAAIMEARGDDPAVLYCASGNRAGAMLALKAYWVDGASPEDALELGLEGGMTRLEAPVRELMGLPPSE